MVRGYEDPPGVMNFRTVKVDANNPPEAKMPGELKLGVLGEGDQHGALPEHPKLQTTRAVTLAVRQNKGTQIAAFAHDVEQALDSLKGFLPDDLQIERIHNQPEEVREKVLQFDQNLLEAVAIVVLVAVLFMEWRCALLVAVSIPVTVAMTLGICQLIGIDLQQVSIAAMIIALGLLVDDPVVAGDAINRELAHGQPPDVAAWLGPQKLARAILYATLTNCVAFLPLLLVKGKTGDFLYSLPVVVTASLVSSRIVSMTFVPLLGYYVLRGQKGFESDTHQRGMGAAFARLYRRFSVWCLDHKGIVLTVCVVMLAGGVSALPLLGTAFFPKDLHSVFTVNVYLTEGSPIRQTREETLKVIRAIEELEGLPRALLHDVCRAGRAAVLAVDRPRTASRQLRPDSRPYRQQACYVVRGAAVEAEPAAFGGGGSRDHRGSWRPDRPSACRCRSACSATTWKGCAASQPTPSSNCARSRAPTTSTTTGTARCSRWPYRSRRTRPTSAG